MSLLNDPEFGKDFILLPEEDSSQSFSVSIQNGLFEGVIFRFDEVRLITKNKNPRFFFKYSVGANEDVITDKKLFENYAEKILLVIIASLPEDAVVYS